MAHASPDGIKASNQGSATPESSALATSQRGNAWTALIPIAIGVVVALLMHFLLPTPQRNYSIRIVQDIGIVIVLAVSLNIVNGMTGQFSIGHAGFMTLGGYTAASISYYGSRRLSGHRYAGIW